MSIATTNKNGIRVRAYSKRNPDYGDFRMAWWGRINRPRQKRDVYGQPGISSIWDWREGEYGIYQGYGSCRMYKTPPKVVGFMASVLLKDRGVKSNAAEYADTVEG